MRRFLFLVSITPSLSTLHSFSKDINRGDIADINSLSSDTWARRKICVNWRINFVWLCHKLQNCTAEYLEKKYRILEAILAQDFTTGVLLCPIQKLLFRYTIASGERAVMTVVCTKVANLATVSKNLTLFFTNFFQNYLSALSALKWHNKMKLETFETILKIWNDNL